MTNITPSGEDKDFLLFIKKVNELTGIDLAQYKEAQMKRRLTTLYTRKGYGSFAEFFGGIAKDPSIMNEFLDRMTINVSEFWRNASRWEQLEKRFFPEMLANGRKLKTWSAACSTGEEPYTIAMILAELKAFPDSKVLATDIDDGALSKAKAALYEERSVREVPARYKRAYFAQEGDRLKVTEPVRRAVTFEKGNLLTDRFDTNFDLIVCRNVMIYFTEEAKHLLYHKFAGALRPGGILFVGSTEQIFSPGQYGLEPADTFFYRKI